MSREKMFNLANEVYENYDFNNSVQLKGIRVLDLKDVDNSITIYRVIDGIAISVTITHIDSEVIIYGSIADANIYSVDIYRYNSDKHKDSCEYDEAIGDYIIKTMNTVLNK